MEKETQTTRILIRTPEGRVFLIFILLGILTAGLIGVAFFRSTELGETLLMALGANSLGGRAAAIGLCLARHLGKTETILYNTLLETTNLFLMYSIFVLSINYALHFRIFKKFKKLNEGLEVSAQKYKERIGKFGWFGLLVFVMIPLPVTGPVVGSVVGYFLRMSVLRNFSAIITGCVLSVILWVKFFDFLERYLHVFQYVFAILLVVVAVSCFKLIKKFYREVLVKAMHETDKK